MAKKLTQVEGRLLIAGLLFLLIFAMLVSLLLGSVFINPKDLWQSDILWQIRLPRVLLAALIGLLLSLSGVILQGVLRNPLADPYILGISAEGGGGGAATLSPGGRACFFVVR